MGQLELELLKVHGFDVDGTMRRFLNNEELYLKCLKKFLDDKSFEKLQAAYLEGNCEEAFKAAHTMKGFVSNLGMNELLAVLAPMVEKLRANDMDIKDDLEQTEKLYKETYSLIEKL